MSSHNALLKHVSIAAEDTSLVAKFDIDGNIPGQGAYVVGLVAATRIIHINDEWGSSS